MKTFCRIVIGLAVLHLLISSESARGQSAADEYYRQWVNYRDGKISVDFNQTSVAFALHAIHAETGFQIVMPSPSRARVLNLRLQSQPLEPAIRSLISTIGYQNFALLYDEKGRPSRAVVLGTQPVAVRTEEAAKTDTVKPLSEQEQEKLQQELARWRELKEEERTRIEERLKVLPPSAEREQLVGEYGRRVLGISE